MTTTSRLPLWIALVLSGLGGALIGLQTRLNGGLGQAIDNGYLAAAYSFASGLVVLLAFMMVSPRTREGIRQVMSALRSRRLPWWALTGGLSGAVFVVGQSVVAPILGVALFTVSIVAGQVVSGLLLDRLGVGPGGRVDLTHARIIGSTLAIVAVALTVVADLLGGVDYATSLWLVVVPMLMGFGVAWQAAVNGLLRAAAHSVMSATLISFAVGTVALVIVSGISVGISGVPTSWPENPLLYIGGPIGIIFVALTAWLVRIAGVLLIGMSNVAGQLVAAVIIEAVAPLAGGVSLWMLLGGVLALIAVGVAAIPPRMKARAALSPR